MPKLILLLALIFASPALLAAPPDLNLTSIRLQDQFGRQHEIEFPRQRLTLVTIADQKGSAALGSWLEALKQRYGTNVYHLGIADVRAVPAPLRPFVTSRFKKKYSYPVLLDWSGEAVKRFEPRTALPNIYLLSKEGSLLHHEQGLFKSDALEKFPSSPVLKK
ncbi:MAG: TlpA family protein disulfide reductase [Limisphaerales bacterium]